jgi:hypothetical protein
MVRFVNGTPTAVYLSSHESGTAWTYAALPKNGVRPITYIAAGDHANYATSGAQPYPVAVIGPIFDHTGAGALWDTTLNYRGYWFDTATNTFKDAGGVGVGGQAQINENPSWLYFQGAWGDDTPATDILKNEQYCIFSECHYTAGPTGQLVHTPPIGLTLTFAQDRSRRTLAGRPSVRERTRAWCRRPSTRSASPRTTTVTSRRWETPCSRQRSVGSSTTSRGRACEDDGRTLYHTLHPIACTIFTTECYGTLLAFDFMPEKRWYITMVHICYTSN